MKTLLERFRELPDYRKYKIAKYNVGEVMYLSLLAMLSGANSYNMDISKKKRAYAYAFYYIFNELVE